MNSAQLLMTYVNIHSLLSASILLLLSLIHAPTSLAVTLPSVQKSHTLAVTSTHKAGLAWPTGNTQDITQYEGGKISWYYTWSVHPTQSSLEFVPMFWGPAWAADWNATIQQTLSNKELNITAVLGMNEPELPSQANITAQEGVEMWKTYVQPLNASALRLGSPATTNGAPGKKWLQDFFSICGAECTVDFVTLHWYGTNASQFIAYVEDYHTTFNRSIWVTEWACQNYVDSSKQCSQEDVVNFLKTTQEYLDNATFVERYAWFGAMTFLNGVNQDNALMGTNGRITKLGAQYAGLSSNGTDPQSGSGSFKILWLSSRFLALLIALNLALIGL